MLGHISFGITNLARSVAFYDAVLEPIGFTQVWSDGMSAGYGRPGGGDKFALKQRDGAHAPGPGFHLAFDAPNRAAVDAFYRAALANRGTDNGPPGLRLNYGPTYYAAFVYDPDGYELEVVYQG